ncbi:MULTISPECIES: lytic murein transglycosylase [unclassified Desulfovibrio]|uniref:lytic murein transglycosylase n=1 Tax=unclassified Desulfovibrio TaxID=2593640 RepID=UPI0013EA0D08|nr:MULTISPECIES: lytic murein transglycosylase [unclassified Desulfovibrio]
MAAPHFRHILPPAPAAQGRLAAARRPADLLALILACALLLAACGSARTAKGPDMADPAEEALAAASSAAADEARPHTETLTADGPAGGMAPCWQPLAARLAADGLSGPRVDALLARLAPTPTQSPMGRKIRELYRRRFLPRPATAKPAPQYYKGVVTAANAALCRDFIAAHEGAFAAADARYGVPPAIAASLLFVETRLGKVLGDVPENAFYTLASMAVSTTPQDISQWLPQLPGYEKHMPWLTETLHKRADWAYKETKALMEHMLRDRIAPEGLPGSIYGAVGLCQFMPSNISTYGADGDGDGRVDLFTAPDAIASLAHYLARHGWKAGLSRERQHALLMTYNHSRTYANTILALSDLVAQGPAAAAAAPTPSVSEPRP